MNAINPNGYTASDWSPFNPTIEGVDETTTFSVDLANANDTVTCTFQVEVINPLFEFMSNTSLCTESLFNRLLF